MSVTPETVRAYQRERVRRLVTGRLSLRTGEPPRLRVPEDDPNGVPTAYGLVERQYMNLLDDDIGTRDVLGANR